MIFIVKIKVKLIIIINRPCWQTPSLPPVEQLSPDRRCSKAAVEPDDGGDDDDDEESKDDDDNQVEVDNDVDTG